MSDYDRYAPVSWGTEETFDIRCPSGQVCKARMLEMEDIVELDIMDAMDVLGPEVMSEEENRKGPRDFQKSAKQLQAEKEAKDREFMKDMTKDKTKFREMIAMVDKIVARCVILPKIHRPIKIVGDREFPIAREDREEGVIYTSSIGFEDKMHIFDKVFGGMEGLKSFRDESEQEMGDMADEPELPLSSVGDAGDQRT